MEVTKHDPMKADPTRLHVPARSGPVVHGYNGKEHDDVLRRVNRHPLTPDGKPTIETAGNVITVTMPNHSQWRLTLVKPAVPPPTPDHVPLTAADVATWEFIAAPHPAGK